MISKRKLIAPIFYLKEDDIMSYPKIDFLYLSEPDMVKAGVNDPVKCTDCMEDLLKILYEGDYRMGGENGNSHGCMVTFPVEPEFPNMPKDGPDRRFMAMPAYLGGKFDIAGMKWYGSNVGNRDKKIPRSILTVILNDKETGQPKALMSANLISAYRTAAIPAVGVRYLAREDSKFLGIVGPVMINAITAETFCSIRPIETIKIKGRGKASIERFIDYVSEKCPQVKEFIVCDTLEECVRDSDILSFATSTPTGGQANYPTIKDEWVKKGCLICGPGAVNVSDELIAKSKLVVDNSKLYEAWAEEYPYPTFDTMFLLGCKYLDMVHEGKLDKSRIEDLGGIVSGAIPGRKDDDEIVLYSIGGMPVEDVAWGKTVYDNAVKLGIGTPLNLWDTPYFY